MYFSQCHTSLAVFNRNAEAISTGAKSTAAYRFACRRNFFEDGKVFGDGVNVASRLQSPGIANSILFSSEINSKIRNQQEFKSVSVGRFHFKNVDEPMEVFALTNEGLVVPKKEELTGKLKEIEKKSARKKWILVGVVLAALIIGLIVYKELSEITIQRLSIHAVH